MGEVIQFISKSERERVRLIREAREMYDSIFPPAELAGEQLDKTPAGLPFGGRLASLGDGE